MRTVVVVPTYNEAANIEVLLHGIRAAAPTVEVLVADDDSPDGTAALAEQVCELYPGYRVYSRRAPRGLGRTYVDCFQRVMAEGYDQVLHMDADLSHDPAYIPALLDASQHADLVIGSRYCSGGGVRDWPLHRVLLSRYANRYVRAVTGVPVNDSTAGFRCWSRAALARVDVASVRSAGYAFMVEMTYRAHLAGLSTIEVPIIFSDRQRGASKMSAQIIWESAKTPWVLRLQRRHMQEGLRAHPA